MIRWTRNLETGAVETYTTHEGLVLGSFTRCDRVMSDIYADQYYAEVWDPEKGMPVSVMVGSSFELHCGPWGKVEVDATPEVLAALKAYKDALEAKRVAEYEARERALKAAEARMPKVGRWVRVVRGRKVPVGIEGLCFWKGQGEWGTRVGIRVGENDNEVVWTAASNVEAVPA